MQIIIEQPETFLGMRIGDYESIYLKLSAAELKALERASQILNHLRQRVRDFWLQVDPSEKHPGREAGNVWYDYEPGWTYPVEDALGCAEAFLEEALTREWSLARRIIDGPHAGEVEATYLRG